MSYITVNILTCLSHGCDFEVSEDLLDEFSRNTYDGEGGEYLLSHGVAFMGFCERNAIDEDHIACSLFALTFRGHTLQLCVTFPTTSIHSYDQIIRELAYDLYNYDYKEDN